MFISISLLPILRWILYVIYGFHKWLISGFGRNWVEGYFFCEFNYTNSGDPKKKMSEKAVGYRDGPGACLILYIHSFYIDINFPTFMKTLSKHKNFWKTKEGTLRSYGSK